ncbi:Golgi integral membrane protein 4-like isoform X2 [Eublepharis macularius]|uniref:Golgi integral membrane protein 4-like isoform X2 n=1 Tax=Eublepharis macularius TaxID=481883 RepID=A0AA97KM24_EUBMA|nr:Golgi integral membrane protein 4-like isoform X2 [Eublepharis macularius]
MGTGLCTRRQKGLLQTGFCLVALACLGSGAFLYNHLQQKVKAAEALALKYKQQQEALSAQLQDFLVYKLEAQEALNKEKQDSMNRYGALSSQHKILKNQHEDVKKQLLDLQLQHNGLKLEHRKALETHSQKYSQLQREKEMEVVGLQDTVYKLREESKLLRKAHQDVHSQLLSAQAQMDEFRQLKETLQKMPSFKEVGAANGQHQPVLKERSQGPAPGLLQLPQEKASAGDEAKQPLGPLEQAAPPREIALVAQVPDTKHQEEKNLPRGQVSQGNDGPRLQDNVPPGQLAPPHEARLPLALWPPPGQRDSHVIRFTRTVNSLQSPSQDQKVMKIMQGESVEKANSPRIAHGYKLQSALEKAQALEKEPSRGNEREPEVQSWQDIVNKVNAQMDEEQAPGHPQSLHLPARAEQTLSNRNRMLTGQQRGAERQPRADWETGKGGTDDEELQMDAGMIEREENSHPRKESVLQEPMVPDDAADPAQDPNNQGEDEFEEAELERPDFEEKAGQAGQLGHTDQPAKDATKEKIQTNVVGQRKAADDLMDDYQEDQEQDMEDHGGEVEDADDLELAQGAKGHAEGAKKKDDYY